MNHNKSEPIRSHLTCRVVADHTAPSLTPLVTVRGEILAVEDRKTEWKGWLWGENSAGVGGWIPEKYVDRNGDKGIMLHDYNATELTVQVGEILTMIKEESGWILCRNGAGQAGWVPAANVYL
jgi:hypothetical protein